METIKLWQNTPGSFAEETVIDVYVPQTKKGDCAVVIFPGGGYHNRAPHEGKGYAEFLAAAGITAFVVQYRVMPHYFPLPLLDARRAVRFVRANAEKYGIDKNKIAVMGSSAGGHLAALTSTYKDGIDFEGIDEIDSEDYMPNAQILCYPVIVQPAQDGFAHKGSYKNLIGDYNKDLETMLNPVNSVCESTPQAFIWHTANDPGVHVMNSYIYATQLRKYDVPVEMHIFPKGPHGLGLATQSSHVYQWPSLLLNWLKYIDFMEK